MPFIWLLPRGLIFPAPSSRCPTLPFVLKLRFEEPLKKKCARRRMGFEVPTRRAEKVRGAPRGPVKRCGVPRRPAKLHGDLVDDDGPRPVHPSGAVFRFHFRGKGGLAATCPFLVGTKFTCSKQAPRDAFWPKLNWGRGGDAAVSTSLLAVTLGETAWLTTAAVPGPSTVWMPSPGFARIENLQLTISCTFGNWSL